MKVDKIPKAHVPYSAKIPMPYLQTGALNVRTRSSSATQQITKLRRTTLSLAALRCTQLVPRILPTRHVTVGSRSKENVGVLKKKQATCCKSGSENGVR